MHVVVVNTLFLVLVTACHAQNLPLEEFRALRESSFSKIPTLEPNDRVEVFYLEHLLTSWVLDAAPWNAYHSGLGVYVEDADGEFKGEYAFDFAPRRTDEVMYQLVPEMRPRYPDWLADYPALGDAYAFVLGDYDLYWQNEGAVQCYDNWPDKFTNATFIGKTNGTVMNQLKDWVHAYSVENLRFEPVEIIVNGTMDECHGSVMCHDLFYYAIDHLHSLGFQPTPKKFVFRDHIMLFAKSYHEANLQSILERRKVARYFRLMHSFMDHINKEFTNIRGLLVSAYLMNIKPYLFKGDKYYEVELEAPYVNYCYMAVLMPPERAVIWKDEKLCALGMQISNNQTTEFVMRMVTPSHVWFILDCLVDDYRFWVVVLLFTWVWRWRRNRAFVSQAKKKTKAE